MLRATGSGDALVTSPLERPRAGVVTGAGGGLGRACAEHLLGLGYAVEGWDRDGGAVAWLGGEHAASQAVDVTDADAVVSAASATTARWGRVDFVVNSAGVLELGGLEESTAAKLRRMLDVNVVGTTLVTQAFIAALAATRGTVVNLASTVALKPVVPTSSYAATKAAVAHLTRCWALELGPRGIRVNAVAPGPIDTGIFAAAGMTPQQVADLLARRASETPLRRSGTVHDVARWVGHLVSDDGGWVTGAVLPVDGGMSIG